MRTLFLAFVTFLGFGVAAVSAIVLGQVVTEGIPEGTGAIAVACLVNLVIYPAGVILCARTL